jgi:hypothetical protein
MGSAADRLAEVRGNTSDAVIRLACHAALPVVIDAGLLNLLRVNFFLDPPDVLSFEAEAALLLSPLFREIGNDLYEIEPEVRNILLIGLQTTYTSERVRQVAQLLMHYTLSTAAWSAQPELEQAQQLTALSFVDPARARSWLDEASPGAAGQSLGREWFVAMRRRLEAQPRASSTPDEVARVAGRLTDPRLDIRLSAVRTLAALAQLPDAELQPIAAVLAGLVRQRTGDAEGLAQDARTALSVLREFGDDYADLVSSLTEPVPPRLIVIGDPGAGKSSLAALSVTAEDDEEALAERAPVFFISYALQALARRQIDPENERSRQVGRFFDDLSENVAQLVARPAGSDPGFLDRALLGGIWTSELSRALDTCQVFVPLLSAQYVTSSWCGREWFAFSRRAVTRRPGASTARGYPTGMIPVLWTPVPVTELPKVVSAVQRFYPQGLSDSAIAPQYEAEGIFGLLRLGRKAAYEAIVWRLAQQIAEQFYNYRVSPGVLPPGELHDAFQER